MKLIKLNKDIDRRKEELEHEIKDITTKHDNFNRDSASFIERMQRESEALQHREESVRVISEGLRRDSGSAGTDNIQAEGSDRGSGEES